MNGLVRKMIWIYFCRCTFSFREVFLSKSSWYHLLLVCWSTFV
uniref:Uncharacterized protein n=1 Tax=Rhizophora mucronata TaxID=61149 RepID=A0A2P2N2C1_RHIMU